MKRPLGDHVHWTAQKVLQVQGETGRKPGGGPAYHINQEVYVAMRRLLAVQYASEKTNVPGPVLSGEALDFGTLCVYHVHQTHGSDQF